MNSLLLIAHPGHELRILEWVRQSRPHVVILTHGDGSIGQPRLADTMRLLEQIGVQVRTDWLSPVADSTVYQALLDNDATMLGRWLADLSQAVSRHPVDCIVADEAEGYNPSHDLCRVLANQVTAKLQSMGKDIRNLEFPLIEHPCDPKRMAQADVCVNLSHSSLSSKLTLMKDYAHRCSPVLEEELQTMLTRFGEHAFATECIYPAAMTPYEADQLPEATPYFERRGEERMKSGVYQHVIRAQHLREQVRGLHRSASRAASP